jgi:hypothetical protein
MELFYITSMLKLRLCVSLFSMCPLWYRSRTIYIVYSITYVYNIGRDYIGLDCWSPNINLNRDPRWVRIQRKISIIYRYEREIIH